MRRSRPARERVVGLGEELPLKTDHGEEATVASVEGEPGDGLTKASYYSPQSSPDTRRGLWAGGGFR